MAFLKVFFTFALVTSLAIAENNTSKKNAELPNTSTYAFINIDSNVPATTILLNNEEIGKTPIRSFKVEAEKDFNLTALADTNYYEGNLQKRLNLRKNTVKDVSFKLKKAKVKRVFVGPKAHLYINNKFIKSLNENNRLVEFETGKNIEIYLEDKHKVRTFYKDIDTSKPFSEIIYTLIHIPKDVRLYTTTVENLMWEDTKHAADTKTDWQEAKTYCDELKLAEFTDWELPQIEQLNRLEEKYKDKIYYGYGDSFYWSNDTSVSKNQIWGYSDSKDFGKGTTRKPIKELPIGYVRCVRVLEPMDESMIDKSETNSTNPMNKKILQEINKEIGYDPDLTKDLKNFMLK